MKAAIRSRYGPPQVVEIADVAEPALTKDGVLVRVRASSVNKAEWYSLVGRPWIGRIEMGLTRPKSPLIGADFAGTIESVGEEVTDFKPGDEVFGGKLGAFAEYVVVKEAVTAKPANLTFGEAASIPTAGLTALQALRDKGQLQAGQRVLINGGSGGVGTFAVQIAKAFGAEVTAVCSTNKVDLVGSIGADHVIDYTRGDFTKTGRRYDLMIDVVGSRRWSEVKRVLTPEATVVIVGAPSCGRLLGPLTRIAGNRIASFGSGRTVLFFIAKFNRPDLVVLREMVESGQVTPVVDREFPLIETGAALGYVGEGHAKAKVVIAV